MNKFGNGAYAKVLGVYDLFEEEYITYMQGSSTVLPDYTFGFSETRNCYSAFYDYFPEWVSSIGNLIITWKNGELWTHNNTTNYANFYEEQKSPSIKVIFNDSQNIKKHYNTITTLGNTTWVAPTQGDVNTNMSQQSQLVQSDFRIKDDKYHAAFKRDMLSPGGLLNGRPLKGSWAALGFGKNVLDKSKQELEDAKAGQKRALSDIQSMQMSPESQIAYQQSQMMANQGMDAASKQMAIQEQGRGMGAAIGALGSRRSALAGISGLATSSSDFALKLAAQNAATKQQNMLAGIQTGLQFGGQKMALDQYKTEQLMNYNLGREASINKAKTGVLSGIGSVAGSLIGAAGQAGGFKSLFKGK